MRIDEDKIWNMYMESKKIVTEKKGLPPWLKDKKGEKGNDGEKEEKGEKKEDDKKDSKNDDKKGKGKKNLPPWLKGKGKKVVKEDVNGDKIFGQYYAAWNTICDKVMQANDSEVASLWKAIEFFVESHENEIIDLIGSVKPNDDGLDVGDLNDLEPGDELGGEGPEEEPLAGTERYLPGV
jgi:hypothetical protein